MNDLNPYNCSRVGNLFVGYERLRRHILNGFRNGNSFAILGGRRCGKSSLLMQIEKDLQQEGLAPFTTLVCYFDIQSVDHLTPAILFEAIYSLTVRNSAAKPWQATDSSNVYQHFLRQLAEAKPALDRQYGLDWLAILLVDEMDGAIAKLSSDQFFQNLRNFLMVSPFHNHFRLLASGAKEMSQFIVSGSSPLNNLRHKHLGILPVMSANQLIRAGFPEGLPARVESLLFQLTGRHPYLLQGLLEKLGEERARLSPELLPDAARDFLREHKDFRNWMQAFGPEEHAVYQRLALAPEGKLSVPEIRRGIPANLVSRIDDALTILSYHGVIDDSNPDEPQIAGTMFRDWYHDCYPRQSGQNASIPAPGLLEWAGSPQAILAIVLTDVVGWTAITHQLGNERMNEIRRAHFQRARTLITQEGGYEIKTIGDSLMVVFRTVIQALNFTLAFHSDTGNPLVKIRAGIHVGPVDIDEEDAFGVMVNFVSRLAHQSKAAEIWVSQDAKNHFDQQRTRRHAAVQWTLQENRLLEGFPGRWNLWTAESQPGDGETA